jgi:hypothetical protein
MPSLRSRTAQYVVIITLLIAGAGGYWFYLRSQAGVRVNTSLADPLAEGLVGYWKLDEGTGTTTTDASGNGNDGDLNNTPTWTSGRIAGAISFDGTNESIEIGTSEVFDNLDVKTVSAWINPTALTEYRGIAGRGAWAFQICSNDPTDCPGSTGRLVYYHAFSGNDGKWILEPNSVTANTWSHVVVEYDRTSTSNNPQIFVNGVLQTATEISAPTGTADNETGSLFLGLDGYVFGIGKIDEARIYSRALSQEEVAKLYQTTAPSSVDTALIGHWTFDGADISGTMAIDRSGKGNNGTLTNGPTGIAGKRGQALSFDGNNDFMEASGVQLSGTDKVTVAFWIRTSGPTTGNRMLLEYSDNAGSNNAFYLNMNEYVVRRWGMASRYDYSRSESWE